MLFGVSLRDPLGGVAEPHVDPIDGDPKIWQFEPHLHGTRRPPHLSRVREVDVLLFELNDGFSHPVSGVELGDVVVRKGNCGET